MLFFNPNNESDFPFSLDKQRENKYRYDNITRENIIVNAVITHENIIKTDK